MKKSFQLVALFAIMLLGSCTGGKEQKAVEKVEDQIQEYTATVEAEVKNNIAPASPVRIDKIFVEVGDRVSKGQKLVLMDEASLKQMKLQLENKRLEFNRADELYKVLPNQNGMP